jgi:hypothetical protein
MFGRLPSQFDLPSRPWRTLLRLQEGHPMHPPRITHFIPWTHSLPLPGAHAATAFTIAFALAAGLACDENTPTETRAPVERLETAAGVDGPALAEEDISTLAIPLPVNQNVATTGSNPAFRINQTGTGPNGIFQISRASNTQTALQGITNGRGRAGFFQITNTASTQAALQAQTNGPGIALYGLSMGAATAGRFEINNTSNSKAAVNASTSGTGQAGLFQITNTNSAQNALQAGTNGSGAGNAVYGVHSGTSGNGGTFEITNASNEGTALVGRTPGLGSAGFFQKDNANGQAALVAVSPGVAGLFQANGGSPAVFALSFGVNGVGGRFQTTDPGGVAAVIQAATQNDRALAVSGKSNFSGDVNVDGTLTKDAGAFKIDHPLDPEHKYLSHSFIESPDMMNVYNGNTTLDASGRATVELPDYFEALNRDFRYQLTAIGAPGPNLYIAEGVKQNRFRIAGGRAYAHVSWMVTGVRQDAYAEQHRIKVEEDKPLADGKLVARR